MATRTNVDIELKAKDKVSPSTKKAKGSLEDLGDTTKNKVGPALLGTFAKVAVGAAAAGAAIAVAFDAVQYAATVQQTEMSFRSIAADSGVMADEVIANMRRMSGETINELDMMLAANRANLLGLPVDKFDDLMAIARASATATGGAVKDMFSDIVVGIGRASPMILDNLGIIVKIGKANLDYATAIGKTVKQLTDQEKKTALLNAVLKSGEDIIRKVGEAGQTVTAAEYFQQASAAAADLKATVGELLLPAFIELATTVTTILRNVRELINSSKQAVDDFYRMLEARHQEYIQKTLGISTFGLSDALKFIKKIDDTLIEDVAEMARLGSSYAEILTFQRDLYEEAATVIEKVLNDTQEIEKMGIFREKLLRTRLELFKQLMTQLDDEFKREDEILKKKGDSKKAEKEKLAFADAYAKVQKQLAGYMDPQLKALWDQKLALEAQKKALDELAETTADPARLRGLQEFSNLSLTIEGRLEDINKRITDFGGLGFANEIDEIVAGFRTMSFELMQLNDMTSLWLDTLGSAGIPIEILVDGIDNLSTKYQDTLGVMEDFDEFMKAAFDSTSALEKAFKRLILTQQDWANFFVTTMRGAIMSTLQGIGKAIGDSQDTWRAMGDIALGVIADILDALGKQLVLWSLSFLVQLKFIRAAAAAAAAVAAFAAAAYVRSMQAGGSRSQGTQAEIWGPVSEAEVEAPTTTIYGGATSITRVPDIYIYQTFMGHIIGPSGMEEFGEMTADALETYAGIGGRIHIEEAIAPVSGGG